MKLKKIIDYLYNNGKHPVSIVMANELVVDVHLIIEKFNVSDLKLDVKTDDRLKGNSSWRFVTTMEKANLMIDMLDYEYDVKVYGGYNIKAPITILIDKKVAA